jgi:thiamine biosynthesis lipoprotein
MKCCKRNYIVTFVCFLAFLVLTGCGKGTIKVSETTTGMGTVVQKTVYVKEEEAGKELFAEINSCLQLYEKELLSWRESESEIAKINASAGSEQGYEVQSEELMDCLQIIWQVSEKSNGALDVTVGMVTKAWNIDKWATGDKELFQMPDEEELRVLLQNVGYQKVRMEEGKIYLPVQMTLDLGAVGKGIVCDRIGEYLKVQDAVTGAVITVGGSVVTYGTKPDGGAWNIAIVNPRKEGYYLGKISVAGEYYIATSGDYERYVEKDGIRYHHIMNPLTGYPAESDVCSVTVVSDSGLLSDALSTACFVLGVQEGLKLVEEFGAEALFVTKESELVMTPGMESIFIVD